MPWPLVTKDVRAGNGLQCFRLEMLLWVNLPTSLIPGIFYGPGANTRRLQDLPWTLGPLPYLFEVVVSAS